MPYKLLVRGSLFIAVLMLFLFFPPTTNHQPPASYAQMLSVTNVFDVSDKDAKAGDVLVFDPVKGLVRTSVAYDIHIFGVLQDQAAIVLKRYDGTGKPVIQTGITKVNVSLANGQIKKGDYITTGVEPGYGIKATISGNVLGIALEDSSQNSKYQPSCAINPSSCPKDQINVTIKPEYAELSNPRSIERILEYIGIAFFRNSQDPQGFGKIIKNIIAGVIMLLSILLGLLIINRVIAKSVEAIGRNPLAKRSIQFSLILNILVVGLVVVGSIVAGFIVLKL